jgi:eukaryotic-like serine/threonine-protein kinase
MEVPLRSPHHFPPPAVANGLAYLSGYDGNFYAVNTATGKLQWKFSIAGERRYAAAHLHESLPAGEATPDPFDVNRFSPTIWSGAVYFGSGDGNIYALDAATGKQRWVYNNKGSWVISSPVVQDNKV